MTPYTDNDVVSPAVYADEGRLHAMFARMRKEEPVRWTVPDDYRPFWALTKHADILEVERNNDVFQAAPRNRLLTLDEEQRIRAKNGDGPLLRSIPTMDGPEHLQYRAITRDWFRPSNLKKLEADIRILAQSYIDLLRDAAEPVDFVKQVSTWFPLRVIMLILGVPPDGAETMHRLTGELFTPHDPDTARVTDGHAAAEAAAEFFAYFRTLLAERRREPRNDLLSVIANGRLDGAPIDEQAALTYCISVVAAGHDTTASSIAGGLHAFTAFPEEYAKLRDRPELAAPAAEEILRYTSPVRNFMRVACSDYELRGTTIKAGEAVILLFPSANRDEDLFDNPDSFSISRARNPHIAFGAGPHMCLGMMLARLEVVVVLQEFCRQVEHVELVGTASWLRTNFLGGPKSMPVRCRFTGH